MGKDGEGMLGQGDRTVVTPLTEVQRRLVAENLGLIGVHLKQYVPSAIRRRARLQRDDLFQEGCLGLMRAVTTFRPEDGVSFPAYALFRIRRAVSRALRYDARRESVATSSSILDRVAIRSRPLDQAVRWEKEGGVVDRVCDSPTASSLRSLNIGRAWTLNAEENEDQRRTILKPTLGDRIREKYERAVHQAVERLGLTNARRSDRDGLAKMLVEERHLVPEKTYRRGLRQISRDSRSSFARVAQTEERVSSFIRQGLLADPEFQALRLAARRSRRGLDRTLTASLARRLSRMGVEEWIRRFESSAASVRGSMLLDLNLLASCEFRFCLRRILRRLSPAQRELLLRRIPSAMRIRRPSRRHRVSESMHTRAKCALQESTPSRVSGKTRKRRKAGKDPREITANRRNGVRVESSPRSSGRFREPATDRLRSERRGRRRRLDSGLLAFDGE